MTFSFLPIAALSLLLASATPLTPAQKRQLDTAVDGSQLVDEAALYPLLENASTIDSATKAGTTIPDYQELMKDPSTGRGTLFLVEGRVAAVPRGIPDLARPGPWSGRLQQWFIQTDSDKERPVVVYLTDPPSEAKRPTVGRRIWIAARFFKLWDQPRTADGQVVTFAVFIGKSLNTADPLPGDVPAPSHGLFSEQLGMSTSMGVLLVLSIVGVVVGLYLWRRNASRPSSLAQLIEERREKRAREQELQNGREQEDSPPLPEDPAEAMREMERRAKDRERMMNDE